MDPNSGREKHVTGGGKGVAKRGSGLGTGGPVGRSDGYAGRSSQSQSSGRPSGANRPSYGGGGAPQNRGGGTPRPGGGRGSLLLIVVAVIVLAVIFGGRGCSGGSSTAEPSYYSGTGTGGTASAQTSGNHSSDDTSESYDIFGMLTGFMGSNAVSSGWSGGESNTAVLNRETDPAARQKRTQVYGDGSDTVTIMVYMCGTDLESKSGMASSDLAEMCRAKMSGNVNVLVYTGGCRSWKVNGISSSVNQIYRITDGALERLVEDDGAKVMTDPATLSGFIKWCDQNFPANRRDLIFWDHGCGSISGFGYDEKFPNKGSMSLSAINRALLDSGVTFDFIGFDACLMATLETAIMTANYSDYLIASEETEPGIGWYYTDWLSSLSADPAQETIDTGKNIADGFVDTCAAKCSGQKATLSVIDLAEFENTVPPKLAVFSGDTSRLIKNDNYKKVSEARVSAREFASSSKIDQIDLVDFANRIGTDAAAELADALLYAVKYNRTSPNMTNSYGVSVYFPYKKASKVDSMASMYEDIGVNDEYADCIRSFAGVEITGQLSAGGSSTPCSSLMGNTSANEGMTVGTDAISALLSAFLGGGRAVPGIDSSDYSYMGEGSDFDIGAAASYVAGNQFDPAKMQWYKKDGLHLMALSNEDWSLIETLQVNMFYDDGEGFIDLGLDNTYEFTEDGRLIGDIDNTWLSIEGQPVAFYYETTIIDEGKKTITGRVPAFLDGDRVNLIIVFDQDHPEGTIAGAAYVYPDSDNVFVPKNITQIEEGAQIDFICDYYDYNEKYIDTYYLGEPLIYKDGLQISNTYVGEDTKITYLLTDIYNNEFWTPAVPKQ